MAQEVSAEVDLNVMQFGEDEINNDIPILAMDQYT